MKKKTTLLGICIFILLTACASTSSQQSLSLYNAIEQSAEEIAENLPKGSRVAIVAFESENDNLSDFIMEELTGALFDRNIEVADRQNLEYVFQELNFQMSGHVSDETAKSVGKFLAADMVITGQLLNLDSMYRYRTSAINVETAVRASVTRLDMRRDSTTRRMVAAIANQKTTVKVAKYGVSAEVTPQTAGTFLDRGILFASRGEFEMAIMDFDEAIKINPNLAAAYVLRGRTLYANASVIVSIGENFSGVETAGTGFATTAAERQIYQRAIADFTQAIRLDPNNANTYNERGRAYSQIEDYNRAVADFTQAIRLEPNFASAYSGRGSAYRELNDLNRALADFNQAIQLVPSPIYYNNRSLLYNQIKDFNRALADINEAIQLRPDFYLYYSNRAEIYLYMENFVGNFEIAIADLTQAIRLNPNSAASYSVRGLTYLNRFRFGGRRSGDIIDLDRAIADIETAIRLNQDEVLREFLENLRRQYGR